MSTVAYQSYVTDHDPQHISVAGTGLEGYENLETLHFLNFQTVRQTVCAGGDAIGEPMEVSIALTTPEYARLVWEFFFEVTSKGTKGERLLTWLLRMRYNAMTAGTLKSPTANLLWSEAEYLLMRYFKRWNWFDPPQVQEQRRRTSRRRAS